MTDLKALAARCVDLDEDAREVNNAIGELAGFRIKDEGHPLGTVWYDANGHAVPHRRYLTSLDAALSLARNGDEADALMFRARKNIGEDFNLHVSLWERTGLPYAPTLARYVTAAALLMRSE